MFTLIENGELYTPEKHGPANVLVAGDKIVRIGEVDSGALTSLLRALKVGCETIDATGCVVVPGFIDPHAHIIGAGGEQGFTSRAPEMQVSEIIGTGITTIVGLLGTDATTRHVSTLLAKARELDQEGITTCIYTGSFQVPVRTLTGSITDDLVLIDKIIGVGEISISDYRSSNPTLQELARIVSEAVVGSLISGKAGVVHFHTGEGKAYLSLLHSLLDEHDIPPKHIYPTHIERSEPLMDDAIALARRGAFVDIDVVEPGLGKWLQYYREHGGPQEQLTVSSDAHSVTGAYRLHDDFALCIHENKMLLEETLPYFTSNVARALALDKKGQLCEGMDADILIMDKKSLEVRHLMARGKLMMRDGKILVRSEHEELATGS